MKDLRVHGLIEFEEMIKRLLFDEGVSCTSIAKVLNETPAAINNYKKGILGEGQKRSFTTKTLKKMEETTGLKAVVVIFDANDQKTFRMLQKLNEESLKKIEKMIKDEDKKRSKARKKLAQVRDEYNNLIDEFIKLSKENGDECFCENYEIEI